MSDPIIQRTRREWDEPCRECGGSGTVHRRESFALWTPDEYAHVRPLGPERGVPGDAYVCAVAGGANIQEACREGVVLARIVGRPVAFEFNGTVAVVHADSDPEVVMRAWWARRHGVTYEQTLEDR